MGRISDRQSDQLAASLVVAAKHKGMTSIDAVVISEDGSHAFAVQGRPDSPLRQIAIVPTAEAVNTPIDKSSAAGAAGQSGTGAAAGGSAESATGFRGADASASANADVVRTDGISLDTVSPLTNYIGGLP